MQKNQCQCQYIILMLAVWGGLYKILVGKGGGGGDGGRGREGAYERDLTRAG